MKNQKGLFVLKLYYPLTFAPKGKRLSEASLKNCFPKGIPTIVTHQISPQTSALKAISQPNTAIQTMFIRVLPNLKSGLVISFLKGKAQSPAILKHWIPNGIPTIVIQRIIPAKTHSHQRRNPPKRNQRIFPKVFI